MPRRLRQLYSRIFKRSKSTERTRPNSPEKVLHIPSLPSEILTHIFSFLSDYEDWKAVALCSHQMHEVVLPLLYEHLQLHETDDLLEYDADYNVRRPPDFEYLRDLVLLLAKRPDYARHVKRLTLRGSLDPMERYGVQYETQHFTRQTARVGSDLAEIVKHYSKGDMAQQLAWMMELGSLVYGTEALVAVLLLVLPNLEVFDFCGTSPPFRGNYLINEFVVDPDRTAFTKLREVMFSSADSDRSPPQQFAEWLVFPSLRKIFVHQACSFGNAPKESEELEESAYDDPRLRGIFRDPQLANRCLRRVAHLRSNVEHIELRECLLNTADLSNLIKAPRALKTFIYENQVHFGGFFGDQYTDFLKLQESLSLHARSLENLWLDYDWRVSSTRPMNFGAMDSLSEFSHLKHVRLPLVCLYGPAFGGENIEQPGLTSTSRLIHFLPPNIERFRLSHCEHECSHIYFEQALIKFLQHLYNLRINDGQPSIENSDEHEPKYHFAKLRELTLEANEETFSSISPELCSLLDDIPGLDIVCLDNEGEEDGRLVRRKWGMDEDIEWAECHREFERPIFPKVDVKVLVNERAKQGDGWIRKRRRIQKSTTGGLSIVETQHRNLDDPEIELLTRKDRSRTVWG